MYLKMWSDDLERLETGKEYELIPEGEHSKLQAENKKLREILTREVNDGRAEEDDIGIEAWIEQALKGKNEQA